MLICSLPVDSFMTKIDISQRLPKRGMHECNIELQGRCRIGAR